MPIRPENKERYPKDWARISYRIRFERAGGRCECAGECGRTTKTGPVHEGRCPAVHREPSPVTGKTVLLTTAHLDHTPEHCGDDNLKAMCQACHLAYDAEHHKQTARATRAAKRAALIEYAKTAGAFPLFDLSAGVAP